MVAMKLARGASSWSVLVSLLVLVLLLQAGPSRGLSIRRAGAHGTADLLAARLNESSFMEDRNSKDSSKLDAGRWERNGRKRSGSVLGAKKSTDGDENTWHDVRYPHFRSASAYRGANGDPSNRTQPGPQDDGTGLAPAEAPGVTNALGEGFDPQFLTVQLSNGSQLFVTPEVNFGLQAFLRASVDLNDIYRDETKQHVIFNYSETVYPEGVGTEAADIVQWDDEGRYLYTVSAVADDTMRALLSNTDDVLGEYEDYGRIVNNGTALKGYDPHVIVHPNGKKYLTWSNHEYVQIVEMSSPNTTVGPIVNLVS